MKSAYVFFADGFEDVEAVTPVDYLRRAGVAVTTVALVARMAVSGHSLSVQCDKSLSELGGAPLPDLVVLPGGGKGADNLAASEELRHLVTRMLKEGRLIGAICAAPAVVLGDWGLLNGRAYTCFPGLGGDLADKPLEKRVVVDSNLITSRSAGTAEEFSLALVRALCGPEPAAKIAEAILAR